MQVEITLNIKLLDPPVGVGFCLQKGKNELEDYVLSKGNDLVFSLSVRVKAGSDGSPIFLGEYTQGTPKDRFIYICSGKRAGQTGTHWERRTKIKLASVTMTQIEKVSTNPTLKLVASYQATAEDGGPSCATVPLIGGAWVVN